MIRKTILSTEELTKSFGGIMAVYRVSLSLEAKEIRAIIGPNGAGKTTLFNLLTGKYHPDSGRILFKDEDISHRNPSWLCKRGIARSFQINSLFPRFTVFENVQLAIISQHGMNSNLISQSAGLMVEKTMEILKSVGLSEQATHLVGALPHGYQRQLEIGIALATGPELLLLDEPTAGLAPGERMRMIEEIKGLIRKKGLTLLFIEHDIDVVFAIADRITVMNQGMIIYEGTPSETKQSEEVKRVYLGEI